MTTISLPPSYDIHELRRTVKSEADQRRRKGAGYLSAHQDAAKAVLSECVKTAKSFGELKAALALICDIL